MREEIIDLPQIFETKRTVLKKYKPGDGILFFELISNNRERLTNSFPVISATVTSELNAELFIHLKLKEWDEQTSFSFAIWDKTENSLIGHITIKNIDWLIPRAEIAYFVTKEYEGKGIMTEVLKSVIGFSFETLKINKLYIRIISSNDKSYKVAEKCGFIKEGTLRNDHRTTEGDLVDLYYYGLTKKDYDNMKINSLN